MANRKMIITGIICSGLGTLLWAGWTFTGSFRSLLTSSDIGPTPDLIIIAIMAIGIIITIAGLLNERKDDL